MDVVEVIARFGDTILDIAHVRAHGVYRVGSAPGLELAVPIATSFPLIRAGVLRVPAGCSARLVEHGSAQRVTSRELWIGRGVRIEIELGQVTLHIARVSLPAATVPLPPFDPRPPVYIAAALACHLALWAIAVTLAPVREPLEKLAAPRPTHVHVATAPAPPPTTPPPPPMRSRTPATVASTAASAPHAGGSRRGRMAARTGGRGFEGSSGLAALGEMRPIVEGQSLADAFVGGSTYDVDEATHNDFGNSTRWDPGGTIPTGPYATMSEGRGAGADYDLGGVKVEHHDPVVSACERVACTATGPIGRATVRAVLADHTRELQACYRRHAAPAMRGTIVLAFEIDRDGAVLRASGRPTGELAACVVGVLEKIDFPIAPQQTTVSLSLDFKPG